MKAQLKMTASVAVDIPSCRALRTMTLTGCPLLYWSSTAVQNSRCAHANESSIGNRSVVRPFVWIVSSRSKGANRSGIGRLDFLHGFEEALDRQLSFLVVCCKVLTETLRRRVEQRADHSHFLVGEPVVHHELCPVECRVDQRPDSFREGLIYVDDLSDRLLDYELNVLFHRISLLSLVAVLSLRVPTLRIRPYALLVPLGSLHSCRDCRILRTLF